MLLVLSTRHTSFHKDIRSFCSDIFMSFRPLELLKDTFWFQALLWKFLSHLRTGMHQLHALQCTYIHIFYPSVYAALHRASESDGKWRFWGLLYLPVIDIFVKALGATTDDIMSLTSPSNGNNVFIHLGSQSPEIRVTTAAGWWNCFVWPFRNQRYKMALYLRGPARIVAESNLEQKRGHDKDPSRNWMVSHI